MPESESKIYGVSVRGWLAIILVLTLAAMSVMGIKVTEPLYTVVSLAVGFYFGQKNTTTTPHKPSV